MSEEKTTKSMFLSKGVIGGVLAVLAGALGLLGYSVTPEDVATIETLISSVVAVIGGVVAVYGRITATKRIK